MFRFGKKKTMYILFQTACGCTKMEYASPNFKVVPRIILPIMFPTQVRDWIHEETDDSIQPRQANRTFRLEAEDLLQDGVTRVYTYREIEF